MAGAAVELRAKSGKPLGRYFPEVVAFLRNLSFDRSVVDGELVIEIDGRLSFALQMRLHPAESRIRKLSVEAPARLVLFDILAAPDGKRLVELPLKGRRTALDAFGKKRPFLETHHIHARSRASEALAQRFRSRGDGRL